MSHIVPSTYISPRVDFGKPPKGYVAGAGRGAVGFTTRSDIGPARQAVVPIDRSISAQKERARQILLQRQLGIQSNNGAILPATPGALVGSIPNNKTPAPNNIPLTNNGLPVENIKDSTEDLSESNYDPFTGYASSLFSAGNYDEEDIEADKIYHAIDKRMDSKRKRRREEREREQWDEYHRKRPKVHEFFAKEKRQLLNLTDDEWSNIPDAVDLSRRRMSHLNKSRSEKYTPVPDSVIETARRGVNGTANSVDDIETKFGGWETRVPMLRPGTLSSFNISSQQSGIMSTDLTQLGKARDKQLSMQLDKMADSITGQTVVDPKGYLTDLTSFHITRDTDVSDIQKARQLLKSVITTNPKHPPGWIAAARLEEAAGKIQAGRTLVLRGCDACPTSQDIWLEAARLHNLKEAKAILARAVRNIPKSVKLWMKASQLENDIECKKAVLRRALEIIPNSVALWKAAVELEDKKDARIMLSRAVECVPESVEMWLALARLEDYEIAKKVLNRAREHCPTDPGIFIAAAKLEEKNNNVNHVEVIISRAMSSLQANKVVIDREAWFHEAAKCETQGHPITCQAIINATISIDVEEQDRRDQWSQEAKEWLKKGYIILSRSIYAHMLNIFNDKWKIWWDAAILEKKYGTPQDCENILKKSVKHCRKAVKLWLLLAKEKWITQGDVDGAREILQEAFSANPTEEQIWLAAVKIEAENKQYEEARKILERARNDCSTPKVWTKAAILERTLGCMDKEEAILKEALNKFPNFDKLWMMRAQLSSRKNDFAEARSICQQGVKHCPNSVPLWLEYANIEETGGRIAKARSVLEIARLKIEKSDELFLAAAKLELNADKITGRGLPNAQSIIAKGLQQCENSGLLHAFAIEIEPLATKKSKCVEAIKKCVNDVHVFTEVAKFFMFQRKSNKAKEWFERAVAANCDWGDAWGYYLHFARVSGNEALQNEIIKRCMESDPHHGILWVKVSKKIGNEHLKCNDILLRVVEDHIEHNSKNVNDEDDDITIKVEIDNNNNNDNNNNDNNENNHNHNYNDNDDDDDDNDNDNDIDNDDNDENIKTNS